MKDKDSSYHIEEDVNKEDSEEYLNDFTEEFSSKTIDANQNYDKECNLKEKSFNNSTIVIIDKRKIITTEETKLDMEEEKQLNDEKVEGMEEEEETEDEDNNEPIKYPSEDSYDGEQGEAIETNISKKQEEKEAKKIEEVKEHLAKTERRYLTNKMNPLMNSKVIYSNDHKKAINRLIPDTHIELHLRKRQFKKDFIFMKNWHAYVNKYSPIRWSDLAIVFLQVQAEHYITSHFARANVLSILSGGSVSPIHLIALNAIIKELTMFRLSEPIDNAFYELDRGFKVKYTDDELTTDPELREKRIKKRKQNQIHKEKRKKKNQEKKDKRDKKKFLQQANNLDILLTTRSKRL